jgi:hypothetical protein
LGVLLEVGKEEEWNIEVGYIEKVPIWAAGV